MRVAIAHLDLGIGGAERLIVDIALALRARGHAVTVFTTRHDPPYCFEATRDGSFEVRVAGAWIPAAAFGGRLTVLFSFLRFFALLVAIALASLRGGRYDVILADQVAVWNSLFCRLASKKFVFYCHFPDHLLCLRRGTRLRRAYRALPDWLDRRCIAAANAVCVNSRFTADVLSAVLAKGASDTAGVGTGPGKAPLPPAASAKREPPRLTVLYPPVTPGTVCGGGSSLTALGVRRPFVLSLNRFEQKKRVDLAVTAFARFKKRYGGGDDPVGTRGAGELQLVVAGGFAADVPDNVRTYTSLVELAQKLDLRIGEDVIFLRGVTDAQRWDLLGCAEALIYTPAFEHFGIVPIEAMAVGTPVLAQRSGGPVETVLNGETVRRKVEHALPQTPLRRVGASRSEGHNFAAPTAAGRAERIPFLPREFCAVRSLPKESFTDSPGSKSSRRPPKRSKRGWRGFSRSGGRTKTACGNAVGAM